MHSLRKWFYKPKREDTSKLAQFYWADEELNFVAQELDSFDGRSDPDRCSLLVNQLRSCQDKVLTICIEIMDEVIPKMRANRDFRAKFPDDVLRENIVGQLWFGAECLAAGSNIIHREVESAGMRPLAKALTRSLDNVRSLLREQSLKNNPTYSEKIKESLKIFDKLFAEFELSYVSAMVPVKSSKEYHLQQEIIVLFSETLQRALHFSLVSQGQVDEYDPALMFAIPRLSIVWGLLVYPEGPLNVDASPSSMSELFRPFHALLYKIRDLLWTLNKEELAFLEKLLCSLEDPQTTSFTLPPEEKKHPSSNSCCPEEMDRNHTCKQFIHDFYSYNFGPTGDRDVPAPDEEMALAHSDQQHSSRAAATNELSSVHSTEPSHVSHMEENLPTMQVEVSLSQKDPVEDLCFCGDDEDDETCFSEEVAVSRTVLSNVMQRVEIVPPANMPMSSSSRPLINCPLHLSLLDSQPTPPPPLHSHCSPNFKGEPSDPQCIPPRRVQALRQASESRTSTTSCSSSYASSPTSRCTSPDTSPYDSECPPDDAELALALQAAEIATCHQARARFRSTEELLHRLFVCIAGVADQLQTNFASDLRNILKCVFDMNSSSLSDTSPPPSPEDSGGDNSSSNSTSMTITTDLVSSNNEIDVERDSIDSAEEVMPDEPASPLSSPTSPSEPPTWVPDTESDHCMACTAVFTLLRRRHHCRNCGRLFCARCSSNTIPLPRFGHHKPVRVCDECFRYQLTPFTMQQPC